MAFAIQTFGKPRLQVQCLNTEMGIGPMIYDKDISPGSLDDGLMSLVACLGLTSSSLNNVVLTDDPA